MKTKTIHLMITLLGIVCGLEAMRADQPEANLRLQMKPMPRTRSVAATPAPDGIDARLEVSTVQSAAAGLRLTVVLVNGGPEPVRLRDPQDLTGILLLDEEGWPLEIPRTVPRGLDDRPRNQDEEQKIVTLAPGADYRLSLAITEVLPRAKEGRTPDPQPIEAGTYRIRVIMNLAPVGDHVQSRMLSTGEPFTVHLGV